MPCISIDKDIVESLRGLFFGSFTNMFSAICVRAYRDLSRTLSFDTMPSEQRKELRTMAISILRGAFKALCHNPPTSQIDFDEWHEAVARMLIGLYAKSGITLTYGQAQKWINMTAKYLYLAGEQDFEGVFDYLHIPIDNYVMDIAEEKFHLLRPKLAWSKWDKDQYYSYQNDLRNHIIGEAPLRWEFRNWLEAARGKAMPNQDYI